MSNYLSFSSLGSQILNSEMYLTLTWGIRQKLVKVLFLWENNTMTTWTRQPILIFELCLFFSLLGFFCAFLTVHSINSDAAALCDSWVSFTHCRKRSKGFVFPVCLSLFMISFSFSKNCCFIHRCGKEWKGNRCHISTKPLRPPTSSLLQNGGSVKKKKHVSMNSSSVSFYLFLSLIVLLLQIFGLGWPVVSC